MFTKPDVKIKKSGYVEGKQNILVMSEIRKDMLKIKPMTLFRY